MQHCSAELGSFAQRQQRAKLVDDVAAGVRAARRPLPMHTARGDERERAPPRRARWTLVMCRVLRSADAPELTLSATTARVEAGDSVRLEARGKRAVARAFHRVVPSFARFLGTSEMASLPVPGRSNSVVLCGERRAGDLDALLRALYPRCAQRGSVVTLTAFEVVAERALDLLSLGDHSSAPSVFRGQLHGLTPVLVESLDAVEDVCAVAESRRDPRRALSSVVITLWVEDSARGTRTSLTLADVARSNVRAGAALRDALVASELGLTTTMPSNNSKLTRLLRACGVGNEREAPLVMLVTVSEHPRAYAPAADALLSAAQVHGAAAPSANGLRPAAPPSPQGGARAHAPPLISRIHIARDGVVSLR
jgi:hypothetical protein